MMDGINQSVFWEDFAEDLQEPEVRRMYVSESIRIAAIDQAVNASGGENGSGSSRVGDADR
jgi:hypothetical protein